MISHATNANKATAQNWGDTAKNAIGNALARQPIDPESAAMWAEVAYASARRAAHAARGVIYTNFVNGKAVQRSA